MSGNDDGWTFATFKQFFERILDEHEKALNKQALEYARRLDDLNHAHASAQEVLHTYVTQVVYDKDMETMRKLGQRVEIEFANKTGRSQGVLNFFAIVASLNFIVTIIVTILTYHRG